MAFQPNPGDGLGRVPQFLEVRRVIKALSLADNTPNLWLLHRLRLSNVLVFYFDFFARLLKRSAAFHRCSVRLCFAYPSMRLGKPV